MTDNSVDNDQVGKEGQRFVLTKHTKEGPVELVYLSILNGQAYGPTGHPITSQDAAEVFLDYVRAAFDEEASNFGVISFDGLFKFDRDGTLRVAKALGDGETDYTIKGVYADARKKLDILLQIMEYKTVIREREREEKEKEPWQQDNGEAWQGGGEFE